MILTTHQIDAIHRVVNDNRDAIGIAPIEIEDTNVNNLIALTIADDVYMIHVDGRSTNMSR